MGNYLPWAKSGPNATFNHNFSWVGLALGGEVRRFHEITFFMKTQRNLAFRKHPTRKQHTKGEWIPNPWVCVSGGRELPTMVEPQKS